MNAITDVSPASLSRAPGTMLTSGQRRTIGGPASTTRSAPLRYAISDRFLPSRPASEARLVRRLTRRCNGPVAMSQQVKAGQQLVLIASDPCHVAGKPASGVAAFSAAGPAPRVLCRRGPLNTIVRPTLA